MPTNNPVLSDELRAVRKLLADSKVAMASLSLEERREIRNNLPQPLPAGTIVRSVDAGGVPAEWLAREGVVPGRAVLYVHGGGFTVGSERSHRGLAARIGAAAEADCVTIGYRLAPEHRYPAALDDAVAAYRWLVEQRGSSAGIVVVGDSAGAGLVIAMLLTLQAAGDSLPAAAVLLSPWLDLELTGDSVRSRRDDEGGRVGDEVDVNITEDSLRECARAYAGDHSLTDPYVSPLHGDLAGLPPVLVHVGGTELLLDDSTRFAERCWSAGVEATLEVWPEMPHVFQGFAGTLPQADEAIDHIGTWVAATL